MTTFPPVTHIALTVRDLSVSVPWYRALIGSDPVLRDTRARLIGFDMVTDAYLLVHH